MPIGISEEHEALRQAARRFLEAQGPPAVPPARPAAPAHLLIVPSPDAPDAWYAVPAAEAAITPQPSVDPTRRVAGVAIDASALPADRRLAGIGGDRVRDLAAVLLSAEAAGIAGW